MAIRQDIANDYFTGEDKDLVFTVYSSNAQTAAQNITGYTITWMLKAKRGAADADALLTKTATLTTAASGICTVSLTDDDISTLVGEKRYFHELKRTDSGNETVLSYGTFTLQQAVHD